MKPDAWIYPLIMFCILIAKAACSACEQVMGRCLLLLLVLLPHPAPNPAPTPTPAPAPAPIPESPVSYTCPPPLGAEVHPHSLFLPT